MLSKQIVMACIGLSCGAAVAGGLFGFITMLGIVPRIAARTSTAKHILFYEDAVILGGTLGNIWILYELPVPLFGTALCLYGIFSGIFVGCLVMALAETLRVFPIMIQRIHLREGFAFAVVGFALGKLAGTLYQFFVPV